MKISILCFTQNGSIPTKDSSHQKTDAENMPGKLFLTATPIGNYDDITIRALDLIKKSNFLICEEYKEASRLLSHFSIMKDLISLNEHNEKETTPEIVSRIKKGEDCVLISDAGTPLFSDPGHFLVEQCINAGIEIVPVPGANSLIPAVTGSGLYADRFYYYGWLLPKKHLRQKELKRLTEIKEVIAVMETPYRLKTLLRDVVAIFGGATEIVVAYKLTMPEEYFYRGRADNILKLAEEKRMKGEFVLLIDNRRKRDKKTVRR